MPTLTAEYLDDFARVKLEAGDLDPEVVYTIRRSVDGGVTWAVVRGATNITDGGVTVVYDYEYAPNTENLYELTAPVVSDMFERTTGPNALVLTGASGAYASSPDAAAFDITGNIDISALINFADYANGGIQTIKAKYGTTANQRSYGLRLNATGNLQMVFSVNGTAGNTATSTVTLYDMGVADGDIISVRVTRVAATGIITFYVGRQPSLDPSVWDAMGATVAGTTGNLFAGTAILEVGSVNNGTGDRATGRIIATRLRNALAPAGSIVANPNFGQQTTGTTGFNDGIGNPWTVNGAASITGYNTAWGDADTGQTWARSTLSNADGVYRTTGGVGRILAPGTGTGWYIEYIAGAWTDVEASVDVVISEVAASTATYWGLGARAADSGGGVYNAYDVRLTANTDGSMDLRIGSLVNSVLSFLSPAVVIGNYQVGQTWRIRMRVVGTVIEARAWNTANPEPRTWHASVSDTTHTTGGIHVRTFKQSAVAIEQVFDRLIADTVPPQVGAAAAVTPVQNDVWLKSIAYPSLNINIGCPLTGPMARRARNAYHDVKGSPTPVDIEDVGSTETTSITFMTYSMEANRAVTALLTYGSPLLLQSPPDGDPTGCATAALTPSGWYGRGDNVQSRPLTGKRAWLWVVPLTRTRAPSSLILPAHMTWNVLWQIAATWSEVWDEWSTWAELWNATIAPDTVYDALMGDE